ncbi:uncharacterized protein A1O9_11613 [Exophiala aquamarina CBS 119918]|uniref:Zn(2)-C6 fungal-type domain-containing protein n=1 Tax=Exophiala aquamarina CBS 119918 TaxID=1182545 RepID=A0A072NY89_9EURO|nr:uncharacterized protein A1O9_11613 [Exophiala aquamarina CBS 119918]KEF52372.1 hypothetical protein A1O9_11613 [Exophiala aquamarina CBS 119918]
MFGSPFLKESLHILRSLRKWYHQTCASKFEACNVPEFVPSQKVFCLPNHVINSKHSVISAFDALLGQSIWQGIVARVSIPTCRGYGFADQAEDTKEKAYHCPYCPRSFQRSDVKAIHVRKCPAAPSDDSPGDTAAERTGRRRVRIACERCRKRKMRCDDRTGAAPSQSSLQEGSGMNGVDQTIDDIHETTDVNSHSESISFSLSDSTAKEQRAANAALEPLSSMHNEAVPPSLLEVNYQDTILQEPSFQDSTNLPIYDLDVPDISLPYDNYPLPDADGQGDFWQTQIMNSQFWFSGCDLAQSGGLFDSNSPLFNHVLSSPMQTLTATMQEYFDRKSRAPSPSLSKASKMWYSAPPNLSDHNQDIVRVFLNIFRRHIPETFPLFKDAAVGHKNRAAYTLAMAATGGLFCPVSGSAEVAKALYNDSRKLLLAQFILLELYGLCSGDKRSYEFAEAFHGSLIHSVQEYSQACKGAVTSADNNDSNIRLLEALYILDCYRVVIMQRPASSSWQRAASFAGQSSPDTRISRLLNLIAELNDGGHMTTTETSKDLSLPSLASLSTHLWPAVYSRQNGYGSDNVPVESFSLWNPQYVELACDNWLRTVGQSRNPTHLAVYHMMNIMLHANLTMLQSFAHSPPGSAARDAKKSSVAKEVVAWAQDRNYKISRWHAENMISSIEGAVMAPSTKSDLSQALAGHSASYPQQRRLPYEAPHVPYAIYYATLILWCGSAIEEGRVSSSTTAQAQLARGERLLSLHKVHIAKLLARVLNEVK